MKLTDRDIEILDALTLRVRLLSLAMVAQTWWGGASTPVRAAAARMAALERAGFVERKRVVVRPLPVFGEPVAAWRLGEVSPDFAAVSQQLQRRWIEPPRMTRVYLATTAAGHAFGREKKPFAVTQATHDLGLAQVFLTMHKAWLKRGLTFVGEDVFGKAGEAGVKDPDGFLLSSSGRRVEAVEFGGRYDEKRVRELHGHCHEVELAYELW